jgi:hypothetical protein
MGNFKQSFKANETLTDATQMHQVAYLLLLNETHVHEIWSWSSGIIRPAIRDIYVCVPVVDTC